MNWFDKDEWIVNFRIVKNRVLYPVLWFLDYLDIRQYGPGTLIEDCNWHPCIIKEIDMEGDITALDLITGQETGCNLYSCGIEKLSPERVQEIIQEYQKNGDRGIAIRFHGWTDERYDEFEKNWR